MKNAAQLLLAIATVATPPAIAQSVTVGGAKGATVTLSRIERDAKGKPSSTEQVGDVKKTPATFGPGIGEGAYALTVWCPPKGPAIRVPKDSDMYLEANQSWDVEVLCGPDGGLKPGEAKVTHARDTEIPGHIVKSRESFPEENHNLGANIRGNYVAMVPGAGSAQLTLGEDGKFSIVASSNAVGAARTGAGRYYVLEGRARGERQIVAIFQWTGLSGLAAGAPSVLFATVRPMELSNTLRLSGFSEGLNNALNPGGAFEGLSGAGAALQGNGIAYQPAR